MDLIELAKEAGLQSRRVASCHGGEYQSPCPSCGGRDRFRIWPNQGNRGRYWCRQCDKKGDAIQFCRDFLNLSFQEACHKVGQQDRLNQERTYITRPAWEPNDSERPSQLWQTQALAFIKQSYQALLSTSWAMEIVLSRGLTRETVQRLLIGYNKHTRLDDRTVWGLNPSLKEDGKQKKQWLPTGLVIPAYAERDNSLPIKLKIRRSDWNEQDTLPKYVEVSGSQKQFSIYGDPALPILLVEAEFDAILLAQEAGHLCCPVALGGASKHPDARLHNLLVASSKIFFSLDFDEAGKKAYRFWKKAYPQIVPLPAPVGKSPGEAFQMGVKLSKWVLVGLEAAY